MIKVSVLGLELLKMMETRQSFRPRTRTAECWNQEIVSRVGKHCRNLVFKASDTLKQFNISKTFKTLPKLS